MRAVLFTAAVLACSSPAGRRPEPDAGATEPELDPPTRLPPETQAIAGQLHGAFLELECASAEIEFQFCVPMDGGRRSVTLKFGGGFGELYDVSLAVWGVMETVTYKDGMLAGDHFYVGGVPGTPDTAEYGLQIGDQTYYLNYQLVGAGEHYTYGIQYQTPPIAILGGSEVTLFVRDPDNYVNTNHMQSMVMNPPPRLKQQLRRIMTERVQGQFVYVEVKSATRR